MNAKFIWAILAIPGLAACGGDGGGLGPQAGTFGTLPEAYLAGYDATTDTVTLSTGSSTVEGIRSGVTDIPGFRGYASQPLTANGLFAIFGETPSGEGAAGAAVWGAGAIAGSGYARLGETDIPARGSAVMTGTYGSVLSYEVSSSLNTFLRGTVTLDVDFGAKTVSGTISDRVSINSATWTFADVTLAQTQIVNGGFAGATTGGSGTGELPTTASAGTWAGLFTGPGGGEVAGAVEIGHAASLEQTEYGAFVAD